MSVRGRLFLASMVLVTAVLGLAGLLLEDSLSRWLENRIARTLETQAESAREWLGAVRPAPTIEAIDAISDRLGRATHSRITIIAADGRVLGDSQLNPGGVLGMENHGDRPEVLQARSEGKGRRKRISATLGAAMLYVALPFSLEGFSGVVRAAKPLDEIQETKAGIRLALGAAFLPALFGSLILSIVGANLLTRTLRRLVARVEGIGIAIPGPKTGDEIAGLEVSFNSLSDNLSDSVQALATEKERIETILETLSEGVAAVDPQGRITRLNPAARRLLSLEDAPPGLPLEEALAPEAPALLLCSDPEEAREAAFRLEGLPPRHLLARGRPIPGEGGWVLALQDVTEKRRIEEMQRDFVANVSHELRTPVSIVRAHAETLLLSGQVNHLDGVTTQIEAIERNAVRLTHLITDLLDLSRIEAGQFPLNLETLNVPKIARAAVDLMGEKFFDKKMEVTFDIPETLQVLADARALGQILYNLLDNAAKYAPPETVVEIRGLQGPDCTWIEVADAGPGIPRDCRDRVFERFFRVDKGRSREIGGTGLGLSIVHRLAMEMGGSAEVGGRHPQGALFLIRLPTPPDL